MKGKNDKMSGCIRHFRPCWKMLRQVGESLYNLGKQVDITTGLLIFAIIGIAFTGPFPSLERNRMNDQHFSLGTLGMTNGPSFDMPINSEFVEDGIMFPQSTPSSTPLEASPAEYLSWSDTKLDNNDQSGTCPHDISGFKPALLSTNELVCKHTCQHENACEIERSEDHLSDTTSCDNLEKIHVQAFINIVFLLKYNLLSLLSLLLLLVDGMFGFVRRWPEIGIGVAIVIVVGAGISEFLTYKHGRSATSFQNDCATLLYVVAQSFMFLSLVLKQAEREWQSYLMSGVAYTCVTLLILGYSISCLTLEYACVAVSALFFFVLFTVHCGYLPIPID